MRKSKFVRTIERDALHIRLLHCVSRGSFETIVVTCFSSSHTPPASAAKTKNKLNEECTLARVRMHIFISSHRLYQIYMRPLCERWPGNRAARVRSLARLLYTCNRIPDKLAKTKKTSYWKSLSTSLPELSINIDKG